MFFIDIFLFFVIFGYLFIYFHVFFFFLFVFLVSFFLRRGERAAWRWRVATPANQSFRVCEVYLGTLKVATSVETRAASSESRQSCVETIRAVRGDDNEEDTETESQKQTQRSRIT